MLGDETIAALLAIWDEELSGERWAELRRALCQLVDQFQQSADDEARAEITMHITDLLRDTDLDLYRKLIAMRRAIRASTAQNRFSTRGMPSGEELAAVWQEIRAHEGETRSDGDGAGTQATAQRDDEPRFIRYTDISCPRYAQVGERITLTVALTMQQQAESVVKQAVHVSAGEVKVRLSAPGFELLSPAEQTVIIEPDADSAPVVFHLKGRTEGQHEIAVQFWQRGNLIATAFVPIEIVAIQPVFAPAIIPSIPVNARLGDARPPDLTLVVNHAPNGHTEFMVIGDGVVRFATQTMLAFEPRAFIQHVYKEIGLLQRGYDSVNEPRALATDQIERRIRTLGHLLWDRLIPPDLKAFYSRERARWRVEDAQDRRWSLLVQSNEADIPWELVRPYGEGDDQWEEGFWCETFYFARWLLKRPDTLTGYAPPPRLRLRALAAIVPTCYPELRAVPDEHALLRDLIARHRLADRSPARATEAAVVDLLEQGGFDWMHIVTHGAFLAESVLHSGALALEDRQWLACSVITGPRIRGKLHAERPAFILNACHAGRSAPMLSGASNWATHLIGSGAGMLIAPLWSVNDALATEFSRAYYDALLNRSQPATLAEAVWHARAAIRRPDEPTWLAYSLFAHPNATVTVTNEGG
ncbi:CHAT domain-containing protein [Chloroflexus sp.]|uniref:CHAT domain-containing protein n=1 Tax=Chloroflexus sp. TaxID=1904827 RepID=UPI00298F16C6|nr:CHAT domain-containing protein [Chloroflexus sp.]MDW8405778.1 CHAT domain-containing protein [Chloroflexus sp.]